MKRRRRVTRGVIAAALLLIGGAIVNVAVAWIVPNVLGERSTRTLTFHDGTTVVKHLPSERHRGWPAKSLTSETDRVDGVSYSYTVEIGSFELPWWPPLWPGFAINTLFYAAILWMLFAVPFALRRKRRRKRGLCPACAYPIGTSPVCTECGRAVSK